MFCVVAILFSIAASQILLGLALVAILVRREFRFPPVLWPLGTFFVWTIVTKLRAEGLFVWNPQIRKFFVFLVLAIVVSAVRTTGRARHLLLALAAAGWLSAAWSLVQFVQRVGEAKAAGISFYEYYTPRRTTGFMSHWMTFSGEMLVVLLIGVAFLLFAPANRRQQWIVGAGTMLTGVALLLNQTRSVWLAGSVALAYLVGAWRPRWLLALPVVLALVLAASPESVQKRAISIFQPHGTTDSNEHRYVTWTTGLAMIRANPVFGVGPQFVEPEFPRYVPAEIPRPLPEGWYGHLHNVYLQMAAERGLPGLASFLWWLIAMALAWVRGLREAAGDRRFILQVALSVWLGTMVSGVFEHNLGNSEVLHLFLATSALGYVALRRTSKLSAAEGEPR